MTPFMWLATLSYGLLLTGFFLRKRHLNWHIRLMLAGIAIDLFLVLTLQIQREAVQTAVSFTLSPLRQTHVIFSTLATALYFPMLYWGIRMVKNPACRSWYRRRHRYCGYWAMLFRSLGFFFMFSLLGP